MCGIAGIVDRAGATPTDELSTVADTMAARLAHRGPDQRGLWTDPDGGVALGFRRLAIVDLTPTGHQPMLSRCGRFAIVFNGEIYNYRDLRRCLEAEGRRFAGESDTEVLVEAIARWGTRAALQRCNGMFAFALWDAQDRRLTLARDRLGEKPLYFGRAGQHLIFASELKAIRAHPSFDATVDRGALSLYLRYSYIPSPFTIYRHARKLAAGSLIELAAGNRGSWPPPEKWWALAEVAA
ncbi:MAG: asparagine synthetase B family protein, partial [Acidimicrobiales bacterium]